MLSYKDFVGGWLDSSVHDFIGDIPAMESTRFALITCLDSDLKPKSLRKLNSEIGTFAGAATVLGNGLLVLTPLLQDRTCPRLFFGFDEIWFFPSKPSKPKPASAWLVGPARIDPARIDQKKLAKLGAWMADTDCSLGLGDGEGLNFIVKARGLIRHLLGHSLDQPNPHVTVVDSTSES